MPSADIPTNASAPFLTSLADTGPMIEQHRADLAEMEKQRGDLETKANDLKVKIDALNGLRQAHGLPGL